MTWRRQLPRRSSSNLLRKQGRSDFPCLLVCPAMSSITPIPFPLTEDEILTITGNYEIQSAGQAASELYKLRRLVLRLIMRQNMPTILVGWAKEFVQFVKSLHNIKAPFEEERVEQYVYNMLLCYFADPKYEDVFEQGLRKAKYGWSTGQAGVRQRLTNDYYNLSDSVEAMTEYAIMVNAGVQIPDGIYHSRMRHEKNIKEYWIPKLGDIKPTITPKPVDTAPVW